MISRVTSTESIPKPLASAAVSAERFAAFGPPPLLEGEDGAAYAELLARIRAAVKPVDIIDEMFVEDVATIQWEISRWRRLKLSLIKASLNTPLQHFLSAALDYRHYRQRFEENLAEILQKKLPEDQAKDLAHRCARWEPDTVKWVEAFLKAARLDMDEILSSAKATKRQELAQEYAQRKPAAIRQVNKFLASSGRTLNDLMADVITGRIGYRDDQLAIMERIDRLITVAETRRNLMLREIDRRRTVLGEALRRNLQEVEGEFKVIEKTPAEVTRHDQ